MTSSPAVTTTATTKIISETTQKRSSWEVFWDLQCPYSKLNWQNFSAIRKRFEDEYDFSIHLTSLVFHPQAFTAQCGASLVETYLGRPALLKYVDACFENQERYMNAALGDAKKSEIMAVFADIADKAGLLDSELTRDKFLQELDNWEKAVKPAYTEHKVALEYGVYGTPKQVINEVLIQDTESAWGPEEWTEKQQSLK
jgi:2-hydroxychromene-2-carboxylate isomerase